MRPEGSGGVALPNTHTPLFGTDWHLQTEKDRKSGGAVDNTNPQFLKDSSQYVWGESETTELMYLIAMLQPTRDCLIHWPSFLQPPDW